MTTSKRAGGERAILNEARFHRHPERFAGVLRVMLVRLEAHRIEAELAQDIYHLAAARARVQYAVAGSEKRREIPSAIQRAPPGAGGMPRAMAWPGPCSPADIRANSTGRTSSSPGRGLDHTSPHRSADGGPERASVAIALREFVHL